MISLRGVETMRIPKSFLPENIPTISITEMHLGAYLDVKAEYDLMITGSIDNHVDNKLMDCVDFMSSRVC